MAVVGSLEEQKQVHPFVCVSQVAELHLRPAAKLSADCQQHSYCAS